MEDSSKLTPEDAGLTAEYANNIFFGPTVWDLKLVFGELGSMKQGVDWHTAITIPWPLAKLMAYYLAINIAAHEIDNGTIKVPENVLPTVAELPVGAPASLIELHKFVTEHNRRFLANQRAAWEATHPQVTAPPKE